MEILVKRKWKTEKSTIGELYIDGKFECYTLEDKDRGLDQSQDETSIAKIKVYGETAIPKGRYQVILSMSNRLKKVLPEILNVKGFQGIRIHSGNIPGDSLGCILLGRKKGDNIVTESKLAMTPFQEKLSKSKDKIYLTIE